LTERFVCAAHPLAQMRGAARSPASPEDRKPGASPRRSSKPSKAEPGKCAHRSAAVLDNQVGLGDLTQPIAAMAFLENTYA
jgi:hypothetical protein